MATVGDNLLYKCRRVHFDGANQLTWRRGRHNPEVSILADRGELIKILVYFEHQWQHKSNGLTHLDAQPDAHIASPRILIEIGAEREPIGQCNLFGQHLEIGPLGNIDSDNSKTEVRRQHLIHIVNRNRGLEQKRNHFCFCHTHVPSSILLVINRTMNSLLG